MIIKDFWKEQWEDRKQRKQQKKENKKHLSKEDKAYKWGYIGFLVFFVFFFFIKSCTGSTLPIDENESDGLILYGYSTEVLEILNRNVTETDVLKGTKISHNSSWNAFVNKCTTSGLDIFKNDDFDDDKVFLNGGCEFSDFQLNADELAGGLIKLISQGSNNGIVELYEFSLTYDGENLQMESLIYLHMSTILNSDIIPNMFVRTTSNVELIFEELVCTNSQLQINNLNEEDNELVLDSFDNALFLLKSVDSYTNSYLLGEITLFGLMIGADVSTNNNNFNFTKITNYN